MRSDWHNGLSFDQVPPGVSMLLMLLISLLNPSPGAVADTPAPGSVTAAFTVDGFPDWVTSVAFRPHHDEFAAGSFELVRVMSAADGSERTTLDMDSGFVRSLCFTEDGASLFCGAYRSIERWSLEKQERTTTLTGHLGYVTDLELSADGGRLVSTSEDGTLRVWDLSDGQPVLTITVDRAPVLAAALSTDGELVATASGDETRLTRPGAVKLWSLKTGTLVRELPAHKLAAMDVVFCPEPPHLLSAGMDERVHVVDTSSGESRLEYAGHSRPVTCLQLTANGLLAISGSGGRFKGKNEIRFWNPVDGDDRAVADEHVGKVTDLALSLDGRRLASASYDKTVKIWDLSGLGEQVGLAQAPAESGTVPREGEAAPQADRDQIRVGIIGLDTSHAIGFTKLLNADSPEPALAGCRVVAAYPKGSPDIESSVSRVPAYTEQIQQLGVVIVPSIEELLEQVDAVLLETNDGRPHLEQVLPVLRAGKPVFVDKPIAGSLADAITIIEAAKQLDVPLFSSSVLRFQPDMQSARSGEAGEILGCDTFAPCSLEPTHPDLFWYGIHGVEALFTVMGTGCESVSRTSTRDFDFVIGQWTDGRIGTFRGTRAGKSSFGGTAFGSGQLLTLTRQGGYDPLVAAIVQFFRSGVSPVPADETLEIYAFMEAADESKRRSGQTVRLEDVMSRARLESAETLKALNLGAPQD